MVRRLRDTPYDRRVRVAILTVVGLFAISRGWVYLGPAEFLPPAYVSLLDQLIPIHVWAVCWLAAGGLVIAGIFAHPLARWSMSCVVSLSGAWSVSYLAAWAIGGIGEAWAPAALFACIAALVAVFTYLMEP